MYARLWWKDVRQFWPIWMILIVAAAGSQWLLLKYIGQDARNGVLLAFATGWALLYGFAVSAAAFAGERENNTLTFLDMIPVGRGVLWRGKASFAMVTTLALAAALIAMACVYTDRFPSVGPWARLNVSATGKPWLGDLWLALGVLALLLEVLGWGLLWSAASSNAMIAAVMSMVCTALGLGLFHRFWGLDTDDLLRPIPWRLTVALATSVASALVITRGGRAGRSWRDLFSPPIAVGTVGDVRTRPVRTPWRILSPQMRALVWQTSREVWPVWWRLVAIGFGIPLFCLVVGFGADAGVVLLLNQVLAVVVGVGVFGSETRLGTQRFLVHHGARPGVVWWWKVAVWGAWFMPPWFVLMVITAIAQLSPQQRVDWPVGLLVMLTGVAVGLLCGMTIRRGITAGLVAGIVVVALGLPQVALISWQMLPWFIPLLVPLVLVAVSWAWSGDWLVERPGAGRWVRFGLLIAGAFLFVFAAHVGGRIGSVPDVGPGFDVAAFERDATVDPKDNAAPLYNEAVRRTSAVGFEAARVHELGGKSAAEGASERRKERQEILALIRRAAAMPRCQFVRLDRATAFEPYNSRHVGAAFTLDFVVEESLRTRLKAGDLDGAWDDLMILFRMERQMSGPVPMGQTYMALNGESRALALAMEWSADPRQTPGRLRAALDAYRALPPMPSMIETVRAESILVENTLNLPTEDIIRLAGTTPRSAANEYEKTVVALHSVALTAPWEIARARRSLWLLFGAIGQDAAAEPSSRPARMYMDWTDYLVTSHGSTRRFSAFELSQIEATTPLAGSFLPARGALTDSNDRNEVARRALVQILALRHWQLTHGGKLPESLDVLRESGTLPILPLDPYANGRPFHYEQSNGQELLPLGRFEPYWPDKDRTNLRRTPGQWLLYSFGPDRRDNGASQDVNPQTGQGDIIFPLPKVD